LQTKNREIVEKQRRIVELETSALVTKNDQLNINEIVKHRDELISKFNRIMEINFNLNEDITKINKSYNEQISVLNEKLIILENENLKLKNNYDKKLKEISEKQNKIDELNINTEKLLLQINDLSAKKLYAYTTDENNKILQE